MAMTFIPDHKVAAFAALQRQVEEDLGKIEHGLQRVFVQQYDSDAVVELSFYANGRRVGVGHFHAPREGTPTLPLSWFSVHCHEAAIGQKEPSEFHEKAYYHFTNEFLDEHLKKVSQVVVRHLIKPREV